MNEMKKNLVPIILLRNFATNDSDFRPKSVGSVDIKYELVADFLRFRPASKNT